MLSTHSSSVSLLTSPSSSELVLIFFLSKISKSVGLTYDDKLSKGESAEGTVDVEEIVAPYLDTLSNFRDRVRKSAQDKDPIGVLKACDEIRDDILPYLGVRLEDKGAGEVRRLKKLG